MATVTDDDYLTHGSVKKLAILDQSMPKPNPDRKKQLDELHLQGYGREFGGKMVYSVGLVYGSSIFIGGFYGAMLGLQKGGATSKLRVNAIMNGASSKGPGFANQCAIITMFYSGFNQFIGWARGEDDIGNSITGGALSGALYKSGAGWNMCGRYAGAGALLFGAIDQGFRSGIF